MHVVEANLVSTWNDHSGSLMVDGDATTCARTGYEFNPTLMVQLASPVTITQVRIYGKYRVAVCTSESLGPYRVYVGSEGISMGPNICRYIRRPYM